LGHGDLAGLSTNTGLVWADFNRNLPDHMNVILGEVYNH